MQTLKRRIVREVPQVTGRHGQPYVVELLPGGMVQVREKGSRERGSLRVDQLFWYAIKRQVGLAV